MCQGRGTYLWSIRRDAFLLLLFIALVVLFIVTGFIVRNYFDMQKSFAEEWYLRGEEDLQAKRLSAALTDFRTALSYSHDNPQYELRLAQTLTEDTSSPEAAAEARTYFLSLLEREPGNGLVNLELARLAARSHDVSNALLYYHAAVYGAWSGDQAGHRREARLELVQFLEREGQTESARAELISVAGSLPPNPTLQLTVGNLLMQVGGYDDALNVFNRVLQERPKMPQALAGAGKCYFQKGDYQRAQHLLSKALQQDAHVPGASGMLATAQTVLRLDPFNRYLGNAERARRAILDFNTARARVQDCATSKGIDLNPPATGPLPTAYAQALQLQPRVQPAALTRDAELLSQVMDTVFAMEQAAAHVCSEPTGDDLALLLLGRQQGGSHP